MGITRSGGATLVLVILVGLAWYAVSAHSQKVALDAAARRTSAEKARQEEVSVQAAREANRQEVEESRARLEIAERAWREREEKDLRELREENDHEQEDESAWPERVLKEMHRERLWTAAGGKSVFGTLFGFGSRWVILCSMTGHPSCIRRESLTEDLRTFLDYVTAEFPLCEDAEVDATAETAYRRSLGQVAAGKVSEPPRRVAAGSAALNGTYGGVYGTLEAAWERARHLNALMQGELDAITEAVVNAGSATFIGGQAGWWAVRYVSQVDGFVVFKTMDRRYIGYRPW